MNNENIFYNFNSRDKPNEIYQNDKSKSFAEIENDQYYFPSNNVINPVMTNQFLDRQALSAVPNFERNNIVRTRTSTVTTATQMPNENEYETIRLDNHFSDENNDYSKNLTFENQFGDVLEPSSSTYPIWFSPKTTAVSDPPYYNPLYMTEMYDFPPSPQFTTNNVYVSPEKLTASETTTSTITSTTTSTTTIPSPIVTNFTDTKLQNNDYQFEKYFKEIDRMSKPQTFQRIYEFENYFNSFDLNHKKKCEKRTLESNDDIFNESNKRLKESHEPIVYTERQNTISPQTSISPNSSSYTKTCKDDSNSNDVMYYKLLRLEDSTGFVTNVESFDCGICFMRIAPTEGVIIRDCLHQFCIECSVQTIMHNETALVQCPAIIGIEKCCGYFQEREIRSLLTDQQNEIYETKILTEAEGITSNVFHCRKPNCHGCFELVDNLVSTIHCQFCGMKNCINCQAIHENQTCAEYQNNAIKDSKTDVFFKQAKSNGLAMNCPTCNIFVTKVEGSDTIMCSMCKTQICWATKGPRWGPKGPGDNSGGCKCRIVMGYKCHKTCKGCH